MQMVATRDEFRDWLRSRMAELGLTPADLATAGAGSPSNTRNWYIGANTPEWHSCYRLAKVLGVSVGEVRRRAGYTDPEEEAPTEDEDLKRELDALWNEIAPEGRRSILRIARLEFGSPRGRRRAE